MRKQTLLIVAPVCVVVLAAGVAVAAPSDAEHAKDAKGDHPHAVRPIAASPSVLAADALSAFVQDAQARAIAAFVQDAQASEIGAFLDAVAAEEAAQARPAVGRSAPGSSGGSGDFLSCVRQRESRGDYTIHNTQGSGASGAYQFMPGTWDSLAGSIGRSDLVGVDPAAASPADQDAMAAELYAQQGARPWGGGC